MKYTSTKFKKKNSIWLLLNLSITISKALGVSVIIIAM